MGIYDELGVRRIINGAATLTALGGSLIPPEVTAAMAEASRSFVDIDDLQAKVGQRIAEWTHNEAAYISCGAAAGLVLSTAACMTGLDPQKRSLLPRTEGMKHEVILHKKGRVGYDFAIRQAGAKLVEIGDEEGATTGDLEAAITDRTAAVFYFYNDNHMPGQIPIPTAVKIAHDRGIPVIVDAAAQLPPVENLWRFTTEEGADLALYSGGKGLSGPQASGLILGSRALIDACAFNACPRAFIGRPMKAGKEEIIGLMTAVQRYLSLDHQAVIAGYEACVEFFVDALRDDPCVEVVRDFPSEAGQPMPRAMITLDEEAIGKTRDRVIEQLRGGDPSIALAPSGAHGLYVNPQTLQPGEEKLILKRLRDIFEGA